MSVVRARAPIRLDLAGGWTDVPPFSEQEGGAVVTVAINRYSYVTVKPAAQGLVLHSADYGRTVEVPDLASLSQDAALGLLAASVRLALGDAGADGGGLALFVRSEAPPGSGTGGSGAVGVALAGALAAWRGARLAPHEAAARAWRAERVELGVAGGSQDQYAAAYGGVNFMQFGAGAPEVSPLRLAPATVAELEKRLVLCYTGISRVSGDIIETVMGAYLDGRASTVEALRELRRIAGDVKAMLLTGQLTGLGDALADNWRWQRALHPSVTTPEIDSFYDRALSAGALGGKALGAGGGGCLLFFADADREHEVRQALAGAGASLMDFGIDWQGLLVWEAG